MSRMFNKKSRVGRPDLSEIDSNDFAWARDLSRGDSFDIITRDAKVIPGFDPEAHDYWYNSPWVSSDVIMLLTSGLRPDQRGLESVTSDGKAGIWHFPADYEQRIQQPLQQLRKHWFSTAAQTQQLANKSCISWTVRFSTHR